MATHPEGSNQPREAGDTDMTKTYVSVLAVLAVVLVALFAFQQHFTH